MALVLSTIIVGASYAAAQTGCPAGTRPATASDPVVQNKQIALGTCYNPNEVGIGQSAEEAKRFLLTRYQPGGCSAQNASREEGIMRLNDDFAKRLARMLKAAPMNMMIISAYRSVRAQQCANPKVTNSNHTKGLAVDMNWDQNSCSSAACQWVLKNGQKDGVHIRMKYAPEWNHLEPSGSVQGGIGPGMGGDASVPPPSSSPSSQLSDAIRQALGQQQPPPPPPPPPAMSAQSPAPTQPTLPSQPALPAQPAISSESPTPVSSEISTTPIGSSGAISGSGKATSTATSTFEQIDQYANPVSESIDIGKAVAIDLNASTSEDVAELRDSAARVPINASGGSGAVSQYAPPQTFTSEDLANSFSSSGGGQTGFVARLLTTLKNILIYALNAMKPFGGVRANQYVE